MQIVVLPHVIEQKLKENERQEVIAFINDLVTDTSDVLKKDIIEILEERFEKKLSVELVNLKLELMERISGSAAQLNEKIAQTENQLSEKITLLSERITKTENQLNERITKTEAQLSEKIATSNEKLKTELVEKIANSKVETIKWMFIFWIGNIITIVGGIIGILKIAKVF